MNRRTKETLGRTWKGFQRHQLTDRAAALTYYGVLALFPGMIVLVALLGVFGQYPNTVNSMFKILHDAGFGQSTIDNVRGPLESVVKSKGGAGALLGIGLLGAIWSASGYLGAFMRAANAVYDVEEGRPFLKLRRLQLVMTVTMVVLLTLVLLAIVVTGPVAHAVGNAIGAGASAVSIWNVAKWPVILVVLIVMVAMLYYLSPNVRQPKLRWLTPGGAAAVLLWILATVGFAFYVGNFGSYNKTYGTLGGMIALLVWIWIGNLALLVGLELDAEIERGRELAAGLPATAHLQLPHQVAPQQTVPATGAERA